MGLGLPEIMVDDNNSILPLLCSWASGYIVSRKEVIYTLVGRYLLHLEDLGLG